MMILTTKETARILNFTPRYVRFLAETAQIVAYQDKQRRWRIIADSLQFFAIKRHKPLDPIIDELHALEAA